MPQAMRIRRDDPRAGKPVAEGDNGQSLARRDFLKSLSLGGLGAVALAGGSPGSTLLAAEPFLRPGRSKLLLGLAAYSFRDYFVDSSHRVGRPAGGPDRRMDMFRFIDYCADNGCLGAELTSYYFPRDVDADFLTRVRRHAFLRGVAITGTAVGNTFTYGPGPKRDADIQLVKTWIERAALMGAPHVRVFAGSLQSGQDMEEAKRLCIEALEETAEVAGRYGVFLGIENHGGIVAEADALVEIVQAVKSPWVGINLDTGNFHTEDPYADLAKCAPYAVNVQFKGMLRPKGSALMEADYPRTFALLRDANYQGYVILEYEMEANPWDNLPAVLRRMTEFMG